MKAFFINILQLWHFTIMEYSYNFNEKNVIHTFLECNDSSKKNKVRLFDILQLWNIVIILMKKM